MGRSQRTKGARGELEACELLSRLTGLEWTRSGSAQRRARGRKPADVVCEGVRLWVEVKRGKRPSPYSALDQARRDAPQGWPVLVLCRRDRDRWCFFYDEDHAAAIHALLRGAA